MEKELEKVDDIVVDRLASVLVNSAKSIAKEQLGYIIMDEVEIKVKCKGIIEEILKQIDYLL